MFNIAVIIPTIGRSTLINVLNQISRDYESARDTFQFEITIYLIAENTQVYKRIDEIIVENHQIRNLNFMILLNKGSGVSSSINTCFEKMNEADYFFIFADDDEWFFGRFQTFLQFIDSSKNRILISKSIVQDEFKQVVRPTLMLKTSNLVEYLYDNNTILFNKRYFSVCSVLFPKGCREIEFLSGIHSHEDIIWFQTVLNQTRLQVESINEVTCKLNVSLERSNRRYLDKHEEYFCEWLKENYPKTFVDYIWIHQPRQIIANGRVKELFRHYITIRAQVSPRISFLFVLFIHVHLCISVLIWKNTSRKLNAIKNKFYRFTCQD